jgi:hypothetical protein
MAEKLETYPTAAKANFAATTQAPKKVAKHFCWIDIVCPKVAHDTSSR